jgi:acetyltransferase-like isoleucine patch superfamily enzyme
MCGLLRLFAKRLASRLVRFGQAPVLVGSEFMAGLGQVAAIDPTADLRVTRAKAGDRTRLKLGHGVYVGRHVEIEAYGPDGMQIGERTTIQDGCVLRGGVQVGRYCIFARNVLVLATAHIFSYRPAWLIRDQDAAFDEEPAHTDGDGALRPVLIEDDCWLGWGSVVLPGSYVGRGALIAANAVVRGDVGPYEIYAGNPGRKVGERLAFTPPVVIDVLSDDCLPYLYRGFALDRASLARSRSQGVIDSQSDSMVVLQAAPVGSAIEIEGRASAGTHRIEVMVNGICAGGHTVAGRFRIGCVVPEHGGGATIPAPLRGFTVLTLSATGEGFGLSRVVMGGAA